MPAVASLLALLWLIWLALAVRFARTAPRLERLSPPDPKTWPRVTVVVPARDEVDALGPAVAKLLAVDYPELEVVLVDDRSTDGTSALVDELARDPRVKAVHVTELPPGWLGKLHALQTGVAASTGALLLFLDADVHLGPGALRRAVALLESRSLDHLTVLPRMLPTVFLVDASHGTLIRGFLPLLGSVRAIEDPRSGAALGVGAFNLLRRRALDASPGLPHLRLEVADDVALAQMLKASGARTSYALGGDLVSLHYYRTFRELARGAEKAPGAFGAGRLSVVAAFALAIAGMEVMPFALLAAPSARVFAGVACALAVATSLIAAHTARRPLLPTALVPLGGLVASTLLLRAGLVAALRGGLRWRDTTYSLRELRAGSRVQVFPRRPAR